METRPDIGTLTSGAEIRRWYWRKDELTAHARSLGLTASGGKFAILDRIAHFLDTGERTLPVADGAKPRSRFDWHRAPLSPETTITDSYKNSQNVRRFFQARIGPDFRFNIAFMEWMTSNVGRTLDDACDAYRSIQALANTPGFKTDIKSHNQFNQYTRDFLADNPDLGMADVRRVWALKTKLPSPDGRHVYDRADLGLRSDGS